MNRRQLIKGTAVVGGVVVAGGAGAMWMGDGRGTWETEVEVLRRSLSPGASASEQGRELVRAATLAANSHNTQPWRFTQSETAITIAPDFSRRCAVVDPDDHHLYASLGCAAENMVQAAPLLGLAAEARFDPAADGVAVDLRPGAAGASSGLGAAITQRQCSRSLYDGRALPADQLRALEAAGKGDGVAVMLITDKATIEDVLALVIEGNTAQVEDPAFVAELKQWLRFSYRDAVATRDGLFSAASGNPVLPGIVANLLFGLVFTAKSENARYVGQVRSSSGLAVFVSEANDKRHWVEAGRAFERFALTATTLGVRHAFVNQAVEVADVRRRLAERLGLGDRRPDFVVRFGHGPEMPRSLRRPVDAVLAA